MVRYYCGSTLLHLIGGGEVVVNQDLLHLVGWDVIVDQDPLHLSGWDVVDQDLLVLVGWDVVVNQEIPHLVEGEAVVHGSRNSSPNWWRSCC